MRYYTGRDLFQLIDGAADMYLAYGFRQLARTDYRKTGSPFVANVEIYDMGTVLGAWGRYSLQLSDSRDPASLQAQAVRQGGGGFLGTNELVFWKGQFLVKLALAPGDESEDQDEQALAAQARVVLPSLASRIASNLTGETTPPAPPSALPGDGLVWSGMTYLAEGALGFSNPGPAWVGHYQTSDQKRYRLSAMIRETPREAQTILSRLRTPQSSTLTGIGDEAFSTQGPQGECLVARKGNTVLVVATPELSSLPAPSREARLELLRAATSALP